jgi:hypothetical protein
MATKAEIVFDEQAFLWDFIDIFNNSIGAPDLRRQLRAIGSTDPIRTKLLNPAKYANFIQLKDKQPSLTLNKLVGNGISALDGLTSAQLSSLVPEMRLFKVVKSPPNKERDIEFPFSKFTEVESILTSTLGRGTDVGIKGVTLRDTGTNPANVGVAFEGNLSLFFQSFDAIFKERNVGGDDKLAFADLLDKTEALGRKPGEQPTSEKAASTDTFSGFKIKLTIGWITPEDPGAVLGFTPEQKKAIESLRRSYILENADQTLNINQSDASVDLDIKFYAKIDGMSLSTRADLLYIDDSNTQDDYVSQRANQTELRDILRQERQLLRNDLRKAKREEQKAISTTRTKDSGLYKVLGSSSGNTNSDSATNIEDLEKEIKKITQEINKTISESRSISYKRLLNMLRNNFSDIEKNANGKIRYIDLPQSTVDAYEQILEGATNSIQKKEEVSELTADKDKRKETINKIKEEYKSERSAGISALKSKVASAKVASNSKEPGDAADVLKFPTEVDGPPSQNTHTIPNGSGLRLHYFYLGDLIEAVFEIIYNRPETKDGSRIARKDATKNKDIYEELKMMMGPFVYYIPGEDKSINMQMADVPISFNYFNAWFYDNVVKRKLNVYVLRNFLRDLCSKLLNNVLSPTRVGVLASTKSLRTVVQSISIDSNSILFENWKAQRGQLKERYDVNQLLSLQRKKGEKGINTKPTEWLYLYTVGNVTNTLAKEGGTTFNRSNEIPHYYIGGQTGLLRNVSFSRTQIPFKFEAALSAEGSNVRKNLLFQDKYDAKIELIGNPVIKPGMLIYLDPRGLGLGEINSTNSSGFQYQLGIGGYYRVFRVDSNISDGTFITNLETVAELDLRDIQLIKSKMGA